MMYNGQAYLSSSASLIAVAEPVKNSIKCMCNICGTVDNYKLSEFKNKEITACKKCRDGLNIGDTKGTLTIKEFRLANSANNKGLEVKFTCSKCGKTFIKSVEDFKKLKDCQVCSRAKATKVSEKPVKTIDSIKGHKINSPKQKRVVGNINEFNEKPELNLAKYRMVGDFIFVGTRSLRSKTGQSIQQQLRGECVHCGAVTIDTENNFKKSGYKCKKCDIINSDRRNVIYNANLVGYVRHNIEIVKTKINSDGVLMADTRCLACGYEMTIPAVTVLNEPELTCLKCGDTKVRMICPLCKRPHIVTTLRRLYEKKDESMKFLCGNETVPASEVVLQHETETRLDNIRKKYRGYTLVDRIPGMDGSPDIFKFEEHYTGTDGEVYHTCMCGVHNKMMVLTDDEMRTYKHEYCAESRMLPYKPNKSKTNSSK